MPQCRELYPQPDRQSDGGGLDRDDQIIIDPSFPINGNQNFEDDGGLTPGWSLEN